MLIWQPFCIGSIKLTFSSFLLNFTWQVIRSNKKPMNECIIPTTNDNNTCNSTQTTTTFYKDELCKQFPLWLYLFIYLGLPVLNMVSATVHGTTTQALNSTSPHERWTTTLGTTSPTLYEQYKGSLTSHRIYMCKGCEKGPTVFCPYPRRLESLTVCRCIYKGSTFFSVT